MTESAIKSAIEKKVTTYSAWTIGVTDNPTRRRDQHGNPKDWHQWDADTETAARNVEKYFLDKGMKGDVGGGGSADYVYIF
ncbi:hypothetical protein ES703_72133 [subsurface metagenome]